MIRTPTLVPLLAAWCLSAAETAPDPVHVTPTVVAPDQAAGDPQVTAPLPDANPDTDAEAVAEEPASEIPSPAPAWSAEAIADLIAHADAINLGHDPAWLILLHYHPGIRGLRSRIDDSRFFLSPQGATDPRAELHAAITAFCSDDADVPATDRFPARLEWLCERLGIDRETLPHPRCAEIERSWDRIADRRVTLVFPDAYLGTPASMFGHTLLVLGGEHKSPLLRQSINYGALANDSNGIVYAYRGVFGKYRGVFSLEPFYAKVQKYIDLDQRDLWEYDLALSEDEVRRLVLHVWELRDIWSDYFFFDENCSSNLLFLIDVARPGLGLSQDTGMWVIPIDTVRAVIGANLVAAQRWRPSRASRIRQAQQHLSGNDLVRATALVDGAQSPDEALADIDDPQHRARILDLAMDQLRGQLGRHRLGQAPYQQRMHAVLSARARMGAVDTQAEPVPPPAPETGHATSRASVGGGALGDAHFMELRLRPAIHDLMDPPDGFLPGSQVVFADTRLRWYDDTRRVEVERFDLISLRSFGHRDQFIKPLAWHLDFGMLQVPMGEERDRRIHARADTGLGGAWRVAGGLFHTTLDGDFRTGALQPHYAIGFGATCGWYLPLGSYGIVHPYGRALEYVAGDRTTRWEGGLELSIWPAHNWSLSGEGVRKSAWDALSTEWSLRLDHHF